MVSDQAVSCKGAESLEGRNVTQILPKYQSHVPGKSADLILIDGDPVGNISEIRRVEMVVKDGVLYRSRELYQALGVRP